MVRDLINWILELTLGREQRIRLGRNIFCHARGLCNFDPPVNGEYRIVRILAGSFPPDAIFFDIVRSAKPPKRPGTPGGHPGTWRLF